MVSLCAEVPPPRVPPVTAGSDIWTLAGRHELTGVVAHRLRALGREVPARAWAEHERVAAFLQARFDLVDAAATEMHARGIRVVVLKNGGIARALSRCYGCSQMGDIDLMVAPSDFEAAHRIMLGHGFAVRFRDRFAAADETATLRKGSAEYSMALGDAVCWVELQSRPVDGRWIRPDQEPAAHDLVERSREISGTALRLLAPEDNLLQVALHTAKHSYVRAPGLRLHLDVERILRHEEIDWQAFVALTERYRVATPVYFSLAIPASLFGTPVPPWVLDRLRPSRIKEAAVFGFIRSAGLLEPDQHKFGRLSYLAFSALLYDDVRGLWRAAFPSRDWMQAQYGPSSRALSLAYASRLAMLLFRRSKT